VVKSYLHLHTVFGHPEIIIETGGVLPIPEFKV
jgi:hypothetical protein